ncbi:MAG: hypothetical protein ABI972_13995 [Acidobacteriota bacterium]
MRRIAFLLAFLFTAASTLPAQFGDFAVTDDGRLYFDTQLTTAGTADISSKVYRITSEGLSLVAAGGGGNNPFGQSTSFPLTSGDGSITGYSLNYPCSSGSCGLSGLPHSFFQLQGVELSVPAFNYNLQISRNGRFLFGASAFDGTRLVELPSQRDRRMPESLIMSGSQSVANSGSVLMRDGRTQTSVLLLVPLDGEPAAVPGTGNATMGILSPDGSRVAYERQNGAQFELVLTDPHGSAHRVLASTPVRSTYRPSFANDGTLVYLQPGFEGRGVPMLLASGGEPRALLTVESGVTQAIISGNAQLVWLASATGQLLRVRTADDVADEIIAESPSVYSSSFFAVPGSVVRLPGMGFTPRTQFLLGDRALPVSEVKPNEVAVQIPWEYDLQSGARELTVRGPASPFLQRVGFAPGSLPTISFERSNTNGLAQVAHQDFRGVVTADDPARQGETLHVFARNMGPVDLPVTTGQRSPSSPPARVITPLACYLIELDAKDLPVRSQGIVVPFAGLSGGSIGIYQIDVTIPSGWYAAKTTLQCRMASEPNRFQGDATKLDVAPLESTATAISPTP